MAEQARRRNWVRTLAPWIIGIAIFVVIAMQVPFATFRASLQHGPHVALAITELVIAIVVLFTDSLSAWVGLLVLRIRWPFARVTAIRGATYLLVLLNYAFGHGGFAYYLYRSGVNAKRAVGATLFLLGTTLATLLVLTFGIWLVADGRSVNVQMWWTLVAMMIAFTVYLLVIATRVRFLADREILAPLFEANLKGHAIAIIGRLPHVVVIVFAHWVAMIVWGIELPVEVVAVFMPAVALAAVLPISPAGLGTIQAAMVFFFVDYAPGATADERTASLLGFGMIHYVYGVIFTALVGLVCIALAKRSGFLTTERAESS